MSRARRRRAAATAASSGAAAQDDGDEPRARPSLGLRGAVGSCLRPGAAGGASTSRALARQRVGRPFNPRHSTSSSPGAAPKPRRRRGGERVTPPPPTIGGCSGARPPDPRLQVGRQAVDQRAPEVRRRAPPRSPSGGGPASPSTKAEWRAPFPPRHPFLAPPRVVAEPSVEPHSVAIGSRMMRDADRRSGGPTLSQSDALFLDCSCQPCCRATCAHAVVGGGAGASTEWYRAGATVRAVAAVVRPGVRVPVGLIVAPSWHTRRGAATSVSRRRRRWAEVSVELDGGGATAAATLAAVREAAATEHGGGAAGRRRRRRPWRRSEYGYTHRRQRRQRRRRRRRRGHCK